ncbi:hypothetical protein QNH98_01335 [Myroides sp. mNGS23_01]|nr:hypothetical protein [Myroides sp. mNGS23_01]WHT39380.1 hypothetical protein QNH98_01335 [Myroides sp. mNGS23_01]
MIDSIVLHLEALKRNDFFEEFLVLLEKEKNKEETTSLYHPFQLLYIIV